MRRELERLPSDAGSKLLRALGVKGHEVELRNASDEFRGHCLALTLLGSYLTDAYNGDIRHRKEVSEHLAHDIRQGAHARKVMESYQTWFGEGAELSVLRTLGLFDRPADEKALRALLKPPNICGLTEPLIDSSPIEWRTILAKLRRARLLAPEDPHNPGYLDAHPLVREYFGEQLQNKRTEAWKECNSRQALHLADRTIEALDAIREAETLAATSEARWWCAELERLRGVFLAAIVADNTEIETAFREAIRIAKDQKSISLAARAEASHAEYRLRKSGLLGA